jgi:hypothetical protein
MLHSTASILLAAAVAATQPVPAKPPLDAAQKSAAAAWVNDGIAWTKELTSLGEKLGAMLVPILDGKQSGEAMRAEVKRTEAKLDAKLAYFKARPSPAFAEMNAFRTIFLDYLVWEGRIFVTLMNDLSKIAEDKKMTRDQKGPALMKTLRAQESDENAWKAKIEAAMNAVNTAISRK